MAEVKYGPEIEDIRRFIEILSVHKKVTFITTSSRSPYVEKFGESPKSSQLALNIAERLRRKEIEVDVIDASKLNIHNCLGCVSEIHGNNCGVKESAVKDKEKNPHGHLRCWASHDFKDDELYKIANSIYDSQAVIFFGSQRWGSVNAIYQKVIERLDWIENMHTTLGEKNTVSDIQAGLVVIGQNWNVNHSLTIQKKVLEYFGFQVPEGLFMGWQYTRDENDENPESYRNAPNTFENSWGIPLYRWEKKESDKLSTEKEPNESEKVFYTFKEYLNEIKNIE
jgi:multimeric flavodoxin WrbA